MSPPPEQRVERPEQLSSQALSCFWLDDAAGRDRFMLVGELDLVTADHARDAIRRAQDRTTELICDLGDVWFVDFSGLCVLLEAVARARDTGARMTIANCPPLVPRMLRLLELQDALDVEAAPRLAAAEAPDKHRGRLSNRPALRALD
jgi:anti-anti-sigma factor